MTDKRKGSMSDDDRALAHRRLAAAPEPISDEDSMPVIVDEEGGPTPLESPRGQRRRKRQSVQEFAENAWAEIRALRGRIDGLAATDANGILAVTARLATLEERIERVLEMGESVDDLRVIGMTIAELRVSLFGLDGKNGKMGTLRNDVDKAMDRADAAPRFVKRALAWAGGAILGSLVPAVMFVRNAADDAATAKAEAAAERATVRAELEAAKADRAWVHQQLDALTRLIRFSAPRASQGSNSP